MIWSSFYSGRMSLLRFMRSGRRHNLGFTLLEMAIVVAILAVLATVAVRTLTGADDQARYNSTQTELNDLNAAILGVPGERDADQTPLISGFIADIGRLPNAVGTDPTTQLQELWTNPNNLLPMAIRAAPSDATVTLATGWRGGYLTLGAGQSSLRDGWGNSYDLLAADGATPAGNGVAIATIRSRGADDAVDTTPTTGFNADQTIVFNNYTATVSGTVYQFNSSTGQQTQPTGTVTVYFWAPDPTTGGVAEQNVSIAAAPYAYSFTSTIGPRVVRAYLGDPASATVKSIPVRLMLQPGAQIKDLTIQ
jgi:prepilin-type N-terminal cleavage/methylation domain-containing protein